LLIFLASLALGQNQFDSTRIRKFILAKTKKIPFYNPIFHTEYLRSKYDCVFKKADNNELYELTNNSNPLIRRSALYILIIRHSEKVLDLLDKNSGDTTQYFFIKFGDLGTHQTFLDELLDFLAPNSGFDKYFNTNSEQKKRISDMLERREKERRQNALLYP